MEMGAAAPPPPAPPPGGQRPTKRGQGKAGKGKRRQALQAPRVEVVRSGVQHTPTEAWQAAADRPPPGAPRASERACLQVSKMIREFKTQACVREGAAQAHDHRCCPFFHSERDRRRVVFEGPGEQLRYIARPCSQQFDDKKGCSQGEACGYCHSTAELLYHPEFFRKRLCHQAKRCPRGRLCAFAHNRQELLVPHFTEQEETEPSENFIANFFKTQWCPIGGPHDWENCVYAHTYRDWRRTPLIGYSSWPCPQWAKSLSSGSSELLYEDRCEFGMACPLAHGAKEQLYHPQFYKTSPCSEESCKRGPLCAFTHGGIDARWPQPAPAPAQTPQGPLPWVEEMLERYQPTYWNPPRYHALEDPSRDLSGVGAIGPGRRRGKPQMQPFEMEGAELFLTLPDYGNVTVGALQQATMIPQTLLPCSYRWVPVAEQSPTGALGPLGYGDLESWSLPPYEASPQAFGLTQAFVLEGFELNCEPHRYERFEGGGPPSLSWQGQLGEVPLDLSCLAALSSLSPTSQKKHRRSGLRTPSSVGSLEPSATPTEVPSPRQEDSTGTSEDPEADRSATSERYSQASPHGGPEGWLTAALQQPFATGEAGSRAAWLPCQGAEGPATDASSRGSWVVPAMGQHPLPVGRIA